MLLVQCTTPKYRQIGCDDASKCKFWDEALYEMMFISLPTMQTSQAKDSQFFSYSFHIEHK